MPRELEGAGRRELLRILRREAALDPDDGNHLRTDELRRVIRLLRQREG
jgi:hypothetical protein